MAERQISSRMIILLTTVAVVVSVVLIWPLSMLGKGTAPSGTADEAELRIQPVARVEIRTQAVAAVAGGQARDGVAVYNTVCMACHVAGVAGAPKTGDKAAWAPRIAQGAATLIKSVINGKGAMPPKGGGTDLSEAEIKAAVEYLVGQSK